MVTAQAAAAELADTLGGEKDQQQMEQMTAALKEAHIATIASASAASAAADKQQEKKEQSAGGEDAEDSGDDEGEEEGAAAAGGDAAAKKKKKKKKKKKTGAAGASGAHANACGVALFCQGPRVAPPAGTPSLYNANKAVKHRQQPSPVSVAVAGMYKDKIFPEGQILPHGGEFNTFRTGSEEKRAADRMYDSVLADLREAAEVHRQVRSDFMRWVKPGKTMLEVAQHLERGVRAGLGLKYEAPPVLERGWAFPTGCSLNHVAAHFSPNAKDTTVLKESDVCKIDFGVQINGHIIDCAFTLAFDPRYDPLLQAVQEATNTGLRAAGIDVRMSDIGGEIQEVMESFEVELGGVTHRVKPLRNLCGHNIGPYSIHAGKSVPMVRNNDHTKMEEGELYAIETFGSTGRGMVLEDGEVSHFMKSTGQRTRPLRSKAAKDLLRHIDAHHGTLAFARRWLEDYGAAGYMSGLRELTDAGVVDRLPPLVDIAGSYSAQFEHTFFLKPSSKEILSRGDDY